ncbi:MAG: Fe(3+) ABC transporter substrate-binding protein [Rhodobiaceae bacterium]|nr:Fe(3+) ABC transporter substrate-binding protein [Rhodobiaceae bacterium]
MTRPLPVWGARLSAAAAALLCALAILYADLARAQGSVNLYSSRHYDTDEKLYSGFEEATGIKVNRIEASADELIERIRNEGRNSPADILITVDAGRLWRAEEAGIFAPVESAVLDSRIPAHLRHPDNLWFAFSQRSRMIFYAKDRVANPPLTYEALTDPAYKGLVCTRSSSSTYMLSLLASIIAHDGEDAARDWAAGVYANRARDPEGNDTDQLLAIASGQCDIAVVNSYYFARTLRGGVKDLTGDALANIGWIFPNQPGPGSDGRGAHMNISGAGMVKNAPNPENAVKFLEYLSSDKAQEYFAGGNDEFPAVEGVPLPAEVAKLGEFKKDTLNLAALGEFQRMAQQIYDEVGYK